MSAPSSFCVANPFPVSSNLCQFQKGSGVSRNDALGCEVPCIDPSVAALQAQQLFPSLDDQTVWTAQAAIVGDCDECIYGPVESTLRDFVLNLKSVCCIDDSCLVGIINAILCNPILNYRARYLDAQRAIATVQSQNQAIAAAHAQAVASAQARNENICRIVQAVKGAIAMIPQDGGQGSETRCCLAQCLNNLCPVGLPPAPAGIPEPCPCPPINAEALENACVVIKVSCGNCGLVGAPITCDETIRCDFFASDGTPCDRLGGSTIIGGVAFPVDCLLPTCAPYAPKQGAGCLQGDKAIVLTFKGATRIVSGAPGVIFPGDLPPCPVFSGNCPRL